MTHHGGHAAFAKVLVHTRAWMAQLGRFKYRRADAEPLPTQRVEVDALNNQITSKQPRVDSITTQEMRRLRNELLRNDRHLPTGTRRFTHTVIAL
jgi:hypothetical protein